MKNEKRHLQLRSAKIRAVANRSRFNRIDSINSPIIIVDIDDDDDDDIEVDDDIDELAIYRPITSAANVLFFF